MSRNTALISWLGWVSLVAIAVWALVLMAGLTHSIRRYVAQPREAKLVAVACILELIYIGQMMFGDVASLFVNVLPLEIVETMQALRPTYLLAIHPVAWGLVLLAVFGKRSDRYLDPHDRKR